MGREWGAKSRLSSVWAAYIKTLASFRVRQVTLKGSGLSSTMLCPAQWAGRCVSTDWRAEGAAVSQEQGERSGVSEQWSPILLQGMLGV